MKKIVTIELDELSKSVSAKTKITHEFENEDEIIANDVLKAEAIALFESVSAYSYIMTQKKASPTPFKRS